MRQTYVLPAVAGFMALFPTAVVASIISSPNVAAVDDPAYQDVVCKPPTKGLMDTVPPCVEVETIEIMCTPNGTEPIYFEAHAQCMCGGSYFAEWKACQQCLFIHGVRNEQQMARYSNVFTAASNALCTGTPTAKFQALFSSADVAAAPVTTGATTFRDQFPSQTDISLYFTPTGRQGPGQITGDAVTATNTALVTAGPNGSQTSRTSPNGSVTTPSGSRSANVQSTTSPNVAMPTKAAGGFAMAVAGVALAAAL